MSTHNLTPNKSHTHLEPTSFFSQQCFHRFLLCIWFLMCLCLKKQQLSVISVGFCSLFTNINFRNFHGTFILANSVKRHISEAKHLRIGHDLPSSVNDRVISPFCKGFIFTKLRIFINVNHWILG